MNKIKDIISYLYYERKSIIAVIITLIVIVPFTIFLMNKKEETNKEEVILDNIVIDKKEEEKEEKYTVDIKGEVNSPGCYEIDSDKRIKDVIELAGGLTEFASTDDINLSSKLTDEMVIVIKRKEDVKEEITNSSSVSVSNNKTMDTSNNSYSGKVSINKAGIDELCTLNGIKEARAKKIIEYRETNGPFKSIEEIKNVSGIGEGIFAKIKDNITL